MGCRDLGTSCCFSSRQASDSAQLQETHQPIRRQKAKPESLGDSRKLGSRGSVSSGCPGRPSHWCGRPGGQSPGCLHGPEPSGLLPCSSGSDRTAPPGSESRHKKTDKVFPKSYPLGNNHRASIKSLTGLQVFVLSVGTRLVPFPQRPVFHIYQCALVLSSFMTTCTFARTHTHAHNH